MQTKTNFNTNDGRVPRGVGRAIRERESDIKRAACLRRASSLPMPKSGPRVAR